MVELRNSSSQTLTGFDASDEEKGQVLSSWLDWEGIHPKRPQKVRVGAIRDRQGGCMLTLWQGSD